MAGPNHLWSGDWEQDSARAADQRADWLAPEPDAPLADEPAPQHWWRRMLGVRQLSAGVALLAIAAVAVAVVTNSGGPAKPAAGAHAATHATRPSASAGTGGAGLVQPTATPVVTGPSANWLGMQIVSSPLGAVVNTVPLGSEGDAAGFEPGDVITVIGNDAINSVRQIRTAVAGIPLGHLLAITISRGSSILTTTVTLKERPTIQP